MTTHDPGYDFFATGARPVAGPAPVPPVPGPPPGVPVGPSAPVPVAAPAHGPGPVGVNQFGTPLEAPVVPTGPYAAPGLGGAPVAGPGMLGGAVPADPVPVAAPAYGPGPVGVNQFGTPLDAPVVPTGPYAAPGLGGAPVAGPGMLAGPGPSAPVRAAAPGGHRAATREAPRPGTVLAAGVIGLVVGALGLGLGVVGMLGYAAMSSQIAALESAPELAGSGLERSGMTTVVLVGVVLLLVSGALHLAAGAATVAGRRWGAWTLLVVSALSILATLLQMLTGGDGSGLLGVAVSSVVLGLLLTPTALGWLRSGS